MKTNNLTKKSFLMTMILALSAGFGSVKSRNAAPAIGGNSVVFHSHGSFHRTGKMKGWMKENKRSTFNKNK